MINFYTATPAWNDTPPVKTLKLLKPGAENLVVVDTTAGALTVSMHRFGARLRFGEREFGEYGMLLEEPLPEPVSVESADGITVIKGADYTLKLLHDPLAFELFQGSRRVQCSPSDSHFTRRFRLPPFAYTQQGWFLSLELDVDEPVYGLGEKWGSLDKRGQLIRSYNHDALGVNAEVSYKNMPFAWSPNGWGAFVHTPAAVTHGAGFAPWSQRAYGILVEDSSADLFLFGGENGAAILESYTNLTGRAPVPPLWSLGVMLSRAYYKDAEDLLVAVKAVRARHMPCDLITLDGRAWQDTNTRFAFEWDAKRFPDPAAVIKELKSLNFKVCVWEYPLVSIHNPLFKTMAEKGWLLKDQKSGEPHRYQWDPSPFGEVLTPLPESGIVDFTHPEAYAFWRDSHKPLFDLGIDMIKSDFGEQVEDENIIAYNGDSGRLLHNCYALLYNRCVYEAAERYSKSGPFLFGRAAWTGSQRYPSQWGGDPQADWSGLAGSLRGGLSWGMSGAPFYATDIGGFYDDQRDTELYVRWAQAAIFSAHMRFHGIGEREPWSYGKEAEQAVNQVLRLRYRLLPYIYQTMEKSAATGLPVQRAMALACPDEKAAWGFEYQFMFGDDMMVAPCLMTGGRVECYLPETLSTKWRRFPDGEIFDGGKSHKMIMPLDGIAIFVPEGARIPLGPDVEHTDALPKGLQIASYWNAGH